MEMKKQRKAEEWKATSEDIVKMQDQPVFIVLYVEIRDTTRILEFIFPRCYFPLCPGSPNEPLRQRSTR